MMNKYTARIIKVGASHYVVVKASLMREKKLNVNDFVHVEISDIINENLRVYRCKKCEHYFSSDDENPFCPSCENEDLEVFKHE